MGSDIWHMRTKLIEVYRSDNWKQKVMRMPNDQVIAIYYRFKKAGKIKDAG
jgi:hypothetical protein